MHRGELLKAELERKNINKAEFARRYGYASNKSLYNAFENPDARIDLFIFAIKNYSCDFSKDIPELKKEIIEQMNEEMTGHVKVVPLELHLDVMKKYTAVLEDNNNLLNENIELYRKLKSEKRK